MVAPIEFDVAMVRLRKTKDDGWEITFVADQPDDKPSINRFVAETFVGKQYKLINIALDDDGNAILS